MSPVRYIDTFNEHIGRIVSWAALAMVLVQFTVVVMRYVFGVGSIWMQESIIYLHALLFMLAAGYTLLHDGHVRVDIIYRSASHTYRATVNLIGTVAFVWPVCYLIFDAAWPYVASAWSVLEGSRETSGIPAVYLLKTVILVFAGFVALQGVSIVIHSVAILRGDETPADNSATIL